MIAEIILFSILSISLGIIILLIRKRTFDFSKVKIKIRCYKVLILMAVIEITAQFLFKKYTGNNFLKILSLSWLIYFALLYVSALNIKKSYMMLFFMGTLLNFIVIAANGFKMPVFVSETLTDVETKKMFLLTGQDLIHSLLTENTKFKFLADIITLAPPYPFPKTISIGDVLLLSGIFAFWQDIFEGTKKHTKKQAHNKSH